jgi:hypothetical protein
MLLKKLLIVSNNSYSKSKLNSFNIRKFTIISSFIKIVKMFDQSKEQEI